MSENNRKEETEEDNILKELGIDPVKARKRVRELKPIKEKQQQPGEKLIEKQQPGEKLITCNSPNAKKTNFLEWYIRKFEQILSIYILDFLSYTSQFYFLYKLKKFYYFRTNSYFIF